LQVGFGQRDPGDKPAANWHVVAETRARIAEADQCCISTKMTTFLKHIGLLSAGPAGCGQNHQYANEERKDAENALENTASPRGSLNDSRI
jgi:hypothetical protein